MTDWRHPPWTRLPLRVKGLIGLALPVLTITVLAAPLLLLERSQQRAVQGVAHSADVKATLNQTLTSAVDAETGMRGSVLTGNRVFLEPYNAALRQLPRQLLTLQALVASDPAQLRRLDRVRALTTQGLDILAGELALASTSPIPETRLLEGKQIMDELRAGLSAMELAENTLLVRQRADLQNAYGRMWMLIWFGAIFGTVLSVGATQLLARGEHEVRRLNAELAERVEQRSADLAAATLTLARREGELEASQHLLQSILDYSPLAIHVKDVAGQYVLVNREMERVLNMASADIVGKTARDVMPPRIADVIQAHDLEVIEARVFRQFEETMVQLEGVRTFASTKFPLLNGSGRITGVCGISLDITERKIIDDEIKLARLEAMRADRAKSAFMSQMSHELRTPLNAILGFAQLFDPDALSAEQAENVEQITAGGRHLLALINEVMDITRIESGSLSMSPEAVELADAVHQAVELIRPLAAQRGIVVVVEPLEPGHGAVLADRQRLAQVLINLLSNAVKYNRTDGRITVGFEDRSPGRTRITIADTGAGIPPEKLGLLFQPFERLGANQTAIEGTGLGLALSRAICAAMNGTLGVDSIVDRGSTFWVELPVADRPALTDAGYVVEAAAPSPKAVAPGGSGTILYIEDNTSNLRLMQRVLARRSGVTLRHAPSGPEGFASIRERRPDLILLDLHLPKMSGEEVLQRLWDDPATRPIPVVILTADASPGLPSRLASLGAAALVTKPLDVPRLLDLLDRLLIGLREEPTHV